MFFVDLGFGNLEKLRMTNSKYEEGNMSIAVVLVMHGVPPRDFPRAEMMELFGLHHRQVHASESEREALQKRHDQLKEKMRKWPRTSDNDPFYAASIEMAQKLEEILGEKVLVGFNEFCAPKIEEAIGEAVSRSLARTLRVVVSTLQPFAALKHRDLTSLSNRPLS